MRFLPSPFSFCAGPAAAVAVAPFVAAPRAAPPPHVEEADALRVAHRLIRAGDLAGALPWLDEAVTLAPDLAVAHLGRALCLSHLGRHDEADAALDAALCLPLRDGILPLQLAQLCARQGEGALAMGLLEAAIAATPAYAERARSDPAFAPLRDHPRFLVMVGAL